MGVVGPVGRKSTLIKRVMEELVIPNISDPYRKERARDELPQSGSGKTIMTSGLNSCRRRRWRFPPTDGKAPGADDRLRGLYGGRGRGGHGGQGARMVTTPWYDHEIPMTEAAELGTKKVMEGHCSIGHRGDYRRHHHGHSPGGLCGR